MSSPFISGPCLIYVGLPTNIAALVPVLPPNQNELRPRLRPPFFGPSARISSNTPGGFGERFTRIEGFRADVTAQSTTLYGALGGAKGPYSDLANQAIGAAGAGASSSEPVQGGRLDVFPLPPPGSRITSVPPPPQRAVDFLVAYFRAITPCFLGYCEDTPLVDLEAGYLPYYRDEMGGVHPAERIWEGEEGVIVADFTRWNEPVYALLTAKAANGLISMPTAPRGLDLDGYVGTCMASEGAAVPLWLVLPYAGKAEYGLQGMPPCYRFFATTPEREGLGPLSTRPRKLRVAWRAMRLPLSSLGAIGLYDHDLAGLPPPN